jgi:hypothetical protein
VLPARSYLTAFSDRLTGCFDDHRISGLDDLSLCGIKLHAGDELHSSKQ